MMLKANLSVIISERTRELETRIVDNTITRALDVSRNLDVGEHFHSDIVGLDDYPAVPSSSIHSTFVFNITEAAMTVGLRLDYAHGPTCYFIVHAKQP